MYTLYFCPMHPEITAMHPGACPICGMALEPLLPEKNEEDDLLELKIRTLLAILLTVPAVFIHMFPLEIEKILSVKAFSLLEFALATIVVFVAGYPLIKKGIASFFSLQLNMFSLIAIGVLSAYGYSAFKLLFPHYFSISSLNGLYFEPSAVITTLVLIGQWIEGEALKKTMGQIQSFMTLTPEIAHLLIGHEERKIRVEDIRKGDLLRIKPGEKIPIDGVIKEGQSWVNESMVTGEPIPAFKGPHDSVLAGTLNGNSVFTMEAKTISQETLLADMIRLVAEARLSKAPIQKLVDKVAAIFTPIVLLIACLTLLIWHLLGSSFEMGISHAIAVLIIACPCALGLATPMSMVVGMGLGASHGVLIREAKALELMEKVNVLVIDKTGTLTEGKPMLTKVFAHFPFSESEVLKIAASVEQFSPHPLAESIVNGAKLKQIPLLSTKNFQNIEGKGVVGEVDGSRVFIGNAQLLMDHSVDPSILSEEALKWQKEGLTVLFIALEYRLIGLIAVADPIKFSAIRAIQQLHRENIKIVMATGDSEEAALSIAKRLKIDEIHANALPQDKMKLVRDFQNQGFLVAMAGDGTNDAPALAESDVGIAMSTGTETALYNSGITLLKGDLGGVVKAQTLSRLTMQNVKENLFFAFIYNILAIPLAAGLFSSYTHFSLTPVIASIAMTLSSLSVIGNALRLRTKTLPD